MTDTTMTKSKVVDGPVDGSARVGRNVAAALVGQFLTWAMSAAVVLFLPAYLGPGGMGKLSLATAFAAVLMAIAPLGTSTVLVKEVARNPDRAVSLLRTSLLLRTPLCLVATVLAYGVAVLMRLDHATTILVLVCAGGTVIGVTNDAVASTLQGLEKLPRQNFVAVVEKLVWAGLTILAVVGRAPLWQIAMVSWVSSSIATVCNLSAFRVDFRAGEAMPAQGCRHGTRSRLAPGSELGELIRMGLPFLGWSVCVTLYGQTDPMVLHLVTGRDLDIGWYGVSTKLVGTTLFLPAALSAALIPRLSKLHADSHDSLEFNVMARRALSMAMLCGIPLAVLLGLMPDRILDMLPYRGKFAEAAPVLRIGGAGLILWYLGIVFGTFVIARDGQRQLFRSAAIAAGIGLPLCLLLSHLTFTHAGNAATGAVASDCIVELLLVVSYIGLLPAGYVDGRFCSFAARCLAASVVATIVFYDLTKHGSGPWALLPGAVVYLGLCLIMRCIGPGDLALLRRLLSRARPAPQEVV